MGGGGGGGGVGVRGIVGVFAGRSGNSRFLRRGRGFYASLKIGGNGRGIRIRLGVVGESASR